MDERIKANQGKELIDYLSGGNHELFHSNLLAFIAKYYPSYFKSIFNLEKMDYDGIYVERERNNFDLSISNGKEYVFVLENKMKSFPDIDQLEKYNKKIEKQNKKTGAECKKILLTFYETEADTEEKGWGIISYRQLSENMKKGWKHLDTTPPYFGQFINDYTDYIDKLYSESKSWKEQLQEGKSKFKILKYWKDISIERKWKKLFKAKVILEYLSEYLRNEIGYKGFYKISTGVVRAKPFLEIVILFHQEKIIKFEDKDTSKYSKYWIQIYPHEIQQGFTIPYNVKIKLKGKDKQKRQQLVKNVWKLIGKTPGFKDIAELFFNSQFFDTENFIPKLEGKKKLRAYLYDDAAMVYYNEPIPEDTEINQYFKEKANDIKSILDIFEKV